MNWYTIYWLNGERSVICGTSIEDAFTHAGYGGGASKAIDWYDNGVSETHWYNKHCVGDYKRNQWYEKGSIKTHIDDITSLDPNEVMKLLERFSEIIIEYPSKDQLIFKSDWGQFFLNGKTAFVKYISVAFAEYQQGSYGGSEDDTEDTHHFLMSNSQYFSPENVANATVVFLTRAKEEPFKPRMVSESMEDIHMKQKIKYEV